MVHSRRALPALLIALLVPLHAVAQSLGGLTGTVTDTTPYPLPGVKVTIVSDTLQRTVITGDDGRYRVVDVPVGSYTIRAELIGFETAEEKVLITDGALSTVSFVLNLGCLMEVLYIDAGLAWALRQATDILHIRIAESASAERCPGGGFCVCTEHVAMVRAVVKTSDAIAPTTIRLVQGGAGNFDRYEGFETPYRAGEEYVAFLYRDSSTGKFARILGAMYMFRVRDERVAFDRTYAPSLKDQMPVDEFVRALSQLLRAPLKFY